MVRWGLATTALAAAVACGAPPQRAPGPGVPDAGVHARVDAGGPSADAMPPADAAGAHPDAGPLDPSAACAGRRDGDPCDDRNSCTRGELCELGVCSPRRRVVWTPRTDCELAGRCEPSTGYCVYPWRPDRAGCDDGSRCTAGKACAAGECAGGASTEPPVVACARAAGGPALTGCRPAHDATRRTLR